MPAPQKRKLIPGKLRGRPPVYTEDINVLATRACRLGATNAGLADFFSVDETTIDNWISKKPEFAAAVREGREYSDAHVVDCLYQRATGYTVEDEKLFYDKEAGDVVRAETLKHYPPDVEAIRYWLNNRQRGKWSSKGDMDGALVFNGPTQINDNRKIENKTLVVTIEEAQEEYDKLIGR